MKISKLPQKKVKIIHLYYSSKMKIKTNNEVAFFIYEIKVLFF